MTTIDPSPNQSATVDSTTPDTTYVDPNGVRYVLALNPTATGSDDEATVTQHRDDRTRTVATGPLAALRAMLTTWAEAEGGELTGEPELVIVPRVAVPADYPAKADEALAELRAMAPRVEALAERVGTELAPTYVRVVRADIGDDLPTAFSERTGWSELYSSLLTLADHLHGAVGDRPDFISIGWYDELDEADRF